MAAVDTFTMTAGSGSFNGFATGLFGSVSPTTTTAVGTTPAIAGLYYAFGFTVFRLAGILDNSSISSLRITPSGGSAYTVTFSSFSQDSGDNETQWSVNAGSDFSSGTSYTVEIFCEQTSLNTEATTLERVNPVSFTDFYGATRNVPAIEPSPNEAFKLSWMHDAEKYQFSSAMSIAYAPANPPANQFVSYTGYSTLLSIGNLGSMTDTSVDSIINFFNGATVNQFMSSHAPNTQSHIFTFNMTHTAASNNSQWYKVSFTPSGGSEVAFYRKDLTYTRSGTSHTWTKTYGTDPFGGAAASGTFKLTC